MDDATARGSLRETLIERARALRPMVRESAEPAEQARCIPAATIEAMRQAEFFRIMQPARYGGFELGFDTVARIALEIGRECASTAWVAGLAINHQWLIANFPIDAQDDVWGGDPEAIAFGSYAATTTAEPVEGGYRISGSWPFASGCDHGQWGLLGAFLPPDDANPGPRPALFLVPAEDYTLNDDWQAVGLAATGSKRIECDDVVVPGHRVLAFADWVNGGSPGSRVHPSPLFGIPPMAVLPITICAPALGVLHGAIDDFVAFAGGRETRGAVVSGGHRVAQFAGVQSRLADASAALDAGQLLMFRDLEETQSAAAAGRPISIDTRIRNRRDHAYVTRLALDAVNGLYGVTGGAGLYRSERLQRAWRDINAISHHVSLNWDAVSTMYGQHALGLEPAGQY